MKIFFTAEYNEEELKPLYEIGEVVKDGWALGLPKFSEEELVEKTKDADMIITSYDDITRKVIESAPNLKLIACTRATPVNVDMEAAKETGISEDVSNIVLPLGATMHMDGSAMSAIIKVAFLFGIFGQDFTTGRAILAIIVAIFSSVAMSGIPGGGGTGELVLCTIFFPDQLAVAYPFALALGNLVDPPATMVNAAGDYVVSYIVERFVNGKDWLQKKMK